MVDQYGNKPETLIRLVLNLLSALKALQGCL